MAYLSQIKLSNTTYDVKAKLTEVILSDTSNWKLGLQWRNTTLESGSYLSGVGRHNTGGNSTYPGSISIIPYATSTEPWGGTQGLFLTKDTAKFENQTLLHSGNWSSYCAAASHSHSYLPLSGGTMTGSITLGSGAVQLKKAGTSASWINGRDQAAVRITSYNAYNAGLSMKTTNGSWEIGVYTSDNMWFTYAPDSNYNAGTNTVAQFRAASNGTIYGAVWNDYAEFRTQKEEIKPGYCVASADNGAVYKTTEKFQACDGIVSDTFGFAIGETDDCKTPLAVAGRVLAYCEGDRHDYHSGDTVCAGPEGKVCKMTREEIKEWPDRIIGIVSEIPEYETWGTGNIAVDGRIWIKVK